MLAEPGARLEQELVDRVAAEQGRLERVGHALAAEILDRAREHLRLARRGGAPLLGQGACARIEARRQALRPAQVVARLLRLGRALDDRGDLVAHPGAQRHERDDLAVVEVTRPVRDARRGLQREQPVAVVRLDQHRVLVTRAVAPGWRQIGEPGRSQAPGMAVEVPQHRAAPVERTAARRIARELDAERDRIRERQLRQASRCHRVREPADAGIGVLRQAPERPLDAGKQHEQHQRGRHRLPEQQPRRAQVGARCAARGGEADQREDAGGDRGAHAERGRDRLRVQEIGDGEEPGQEHDRRRIALVARFEQLQAGEQHQQHDPRRAPEQGAELEPHSEHAERRYRDHQPARWQHARHRDPGRAPEVQGHGERAQPPGRAQRVGRDHDQQPGEQRGEVAPRDRAQLGLKRIAVFHFDSYKASASRHAARCASPRPGGSSVPGSRSP